MKNTIILPFFFLLLNCQAPTTEKDSTLITDSEGDFNVATPRREATINAGKAKLMPEQESDATPLPEADSLPVWPSILTTRYLSGRFTEKDREDIVAVPKELTDGDGTYHLHADALTAFSAMHAAAKKDGVKLVIVSAFRNFDRQKSIWEAKWNGQRLLEGKEKADEVYPDPAERALAILRYSSMPGSSRHHWGTDLDLNDLNNDYFATGEGLKTYEWLTENASKFGFCQPYTKLGDERPHGYQEEKWHWSYLPIARQLTDFAQAQLTYDLIQGFDGAAAAEEIKVVERYVLGINQDCL